MPEQSADQYNQLNGELRPKEIPFWDCRRKELWFCKKLVKRFLRPAKNQWLLLDACQEECWPAHILDPLPPSKKGPDHSIRLRQAIRSLNRGHKIPLIRLNAIIRARAFFGRLSSRPGHRTRVVHGKAVDMTRAVANNQELPDKETE